MQSDQAVAALGSLAQEHRLAIFRMLVRAGKEGLAAGMIAEALGVPSSSLSFHLAHLTRSGLISQERQSRTLIYRADYAAMNSLVAYLLENCCAGDACAVDLLVSQGACK
ncbi:ArsR/SmtB family transcription factor [Parasphingorhabdus sp.]|uniref:ArsR/SmtB family transcription factor n=1 Tax=Parasphingorhabdus sp. TaxID=2709688 RepID=UPI003A91C8A4